MTDPIADFLTQIKNGYRAEKKKVTIPFSKLKEALASVLTKKGYIGQTEIAKEGKTKKNLVVSLIYDNKKPKVTEIVRVSKPGKRVYVKKSKIFKVLGGMGSFVISTPAGLLTDEEAKKKGVGGEVICKIW